MLNLVSDSSCDLISGELNSPYARLTVAPMCLHVGGQDYLDTPELDILNRQSICSSSILLPI